MLLFLEDDYFVVLMSLICFLISLIDLGVNYKNKLLKSNINLITLAHPINNGGKIESEVLRVKKAIKILIITSFLELS